MTTAQESKTIQVGFFPPISSDGLSSFANTYNVSLGIIGNHSKGSKILDFASVYNIDTENTKGLQFAGVVNYSGCVDGMQFATINIAKRVNGVQFGVVNISKECDGVPIGLINVVAKGGKHSFEVFASEVFHTALSFKLGVPRFYTIFSAGAKYINTNNEYALGLGFGSHIDWNQKWGNHIELMAYSLTEDGAFQKNSTNMLVQLKAPITLRLVSGCHLTAGPSLNMTISDYKNPQTGVIGSAFTPNGVIWNNKSENTRLDFWAGFVVGIELL